MICCFCGKKMVKLFNVIFCIGGIAHDYGYFYYNKENIHAIEFGNIIIHFNETKFTIYNNNEIIFDSIEDKYIYWKDVNILKELITKLTIFK